MDELVGILEPRDFVIETHQLLWRAMVYQYERNRPCDYVTISQLLLKYDRTRDIPSSYLLSLTESVPSTANAKFYAQIVKSNAIRRRAIDAAQRIIQITQDRELEDDEEYLQTIERLIQEVRPGDAGEMKHIREIRQAYMEYLQQKDDFIFTGFQAFDRWMGGIGRGWLYVLAGRPSVGKTAKMLQMAIGIAKQNVGEVLIFSQEMKREQLLNRMIAPMTAIHANRIRRKELSELEMQKIEAAYDELEKLPLHIEDAKNVTIEEVRATARRIKRRYGRLGAIIVDYLTIMKIPQEKGETRAQAIGRVTKAAKQTALELDCPFIMLAQLNRESKKEKEPGLEHLKESGDIEQDADVVEFLWHNPEDVHPDGKVVQSIIAKGRDVGTEKFRYLFQGWIQRFKELPAIEGDKK
ncbi:replicative DNA helicase [Bacillaceae bacterium]